MDICHPKKHWERTKITEAYWLSRTPWWHCERRLWSLRSFYWTGLVCVSNDCRKSNGGYCEITWLWRTSSWRSICLYPSKIGGRSRIAQSSKVRISRFLDTSFMTHKWPKIMGKHWRSCGSSRTKFIRTLISRIVMGKNISRTFYLELGWEKSTKLGMSVCSIENKDYSYRKTWTTWKCMAGSRVWLPCGTNRRKTLILTNQVFLGSTQRECKPNEIEEYTKMFESHISAGATEKLPGWEKPHATTVAWSYDMEGHARKCVERCCEMVRERQSSYTKFQILVCMIIKFK